MPVERWFEKDPLGNVFGDRCPEEGALRGVLRGEVL